MKKAVSVRILKLNEKGGKASLSPEPLSCFPSFLKMEILWSTWFTRGISIYVENGSISSRTLFDLLEESGKWNEEGGGQIWKVVKVNNALKMGRYNAIRCAGRRKKYI